MGPTLAALCPARCRGVSRDPARRPRAARRPAARRRRCAALVYGGAGAARPGTLTALALSDLMFDADYNPAIRAGIPVGGAGGARPRRRRAAAAAGRRRRRLSRAAGAARLLGRPLRDGVRGDAAAVAARHAVRRARAARPQAEAAALGPRRVLPVRPTRRRRPTRSTSACAGRRRPRRAGARRRLSGGPGAGPPGRRGPAHAAGGLGARGGRAAGAQRVVVPGVGHAVVGRRSLAAAASGGCSRSCAGGRPSAPCPRVPTRVPATGVPPPRWPAGAGGRRARARGADGGGARRHARRPDLRALAGPRLAAGGRAGCAAGASACARRAIVLHGLQVVRGRACQRHAAAARERAAADLGRARGRAAGCGSRRAAWCAAGSAAGACAGGCGRGRRGRWRAVRESRWRRRHDSGTGRRCLPSDRGRSFLPPRPPSAVPAASTRSTPR